MKPTTPLLVSLLSLTTTIALPTVHTTLEKRVAAPIEPSAVTLIESLEGFRANFYTINGDQTIGFGHDCTQRGGCTTLHPPITRAQGTTLLKSDLVTYETCVCALPNAANLNANQYGALVSFTYNAGCGNVDKYFRADMQASNFQGICSALPTTDTLNGQLTSRRQKESAFCSQASSAGSGCGGSGGGKPPGGGGPTHTSAAVQARRTP